MTEATIPLLFALIAIVIAALSRLKRLSTRRSPSATRCMMGFTSLSFLLASGALAIASIGDNESAPRMDEAVVSIVFLLGGLGFGLHMFEIAPHAYDDRFPRHPSKAGSRFTEVSMTIAAFAFLPASGQLLFFYTLAAL